MDFPRHIVAAGGLVTNPEGKVLLINSPKRGWEFPGGQIEIGEDIIEGLQREIEEETGIIASMGRMVGVYSNIAEPTKVMFGFLGTAVSGELRTSAESLEVGWFDKGEAVRMVTPPFLKDRLNDMIGFDGRVVYRVYTTNPYKVYREVFV